MNPAAEWLEESAQYCPCGNLIVAWNGAAWIVARCPRADCRLRGICPDCRTGHDRGVCEVDAA